MTDRGRSRHYGAAPAKANGAAANAQTLELRPRHKAPASPEAADLAATGPGPALDRVRLESELDRLRNEHARLLEAKEELAASLEERARRAQQLLGERTQLEARLREQDEQIQRLNRELGAASRPAPQPYRPARTAARLQLGTWLAALAGRLAGTRPRSGASATHAPSLASSSGADLQPLTKEAAPRPLIVVIALGLGRDELPNVLELVTRYCRERAMTPLLLIDHDGLEMFRARRMLFEYLPPAASRVRLAPDLDWDLYVQRRLALLRRKWQPARIVAFGEHAAGVARLWRSSPFEDESINGLTRTADGTAAL